jgi:hypothetical protein
MHGLLDFERVVCYLSLDYFYPQRCTGDDWFLLFIYTIAHFHPESFYQAFERHRLVVVARTSSPTIFLEALPSAVFFKIDHESRS